MGLKKYVFANNSSCEHFISHVLLHKTSMNVAIAGIFLYS